MAATSRPWFRVYAEMARDRKLRREKPETRWLWVTLMCMASASPVRGVLMVGHGFATYEDIADEAALPVAKVRAGMKSLQVAGMVSLADGAWTLCNWDARQFESDRSTDRVKAFRERRRNVSSDVAVTPPDTEVPDPEPVVSSSSSSEPPELEPVDDETMSKYRAVLAHAAGVKMPTNGVTNPAAYKAKVVEELEVEWSARLRGIIRRHPQAPVNVLAGYVLGEPTPSLQQYRVSA